MAPPPNSLGEVYLESLQSATVCYCAISEPLEQIVVEILDEGDEEPAQTDTGPGALQKDKTRARVRARARRPPRRATTKHATSTTTVRSTSHWLRAVLSTAPRDVGARSRRRRTRSGTPTATNSCKGPCRSPNPNRKLWLEARLTGDVLALCWNSASEVRENLHPAECHPALFSHRLHAGRLVARPYMFVVDTKYCVQNRHNYIEAVARMKLDAEKRHRGQIRPPACVQLVVGGDW